MFLALLRAVPTGLGYLAGHLVAYHSKQYELKNGKNLWYPVIASTLVLLGTSILISNKAFQTGVALKVLVTTIDAVVPKKDDLRGYIGLHPKHMVYNGVEDAPSREC
jgi:hypothetical protein